jgi:hypothetical protein
MTLSAETAHLLYYLSLLQSGANFSINRLPAYHQNGE